jgi:hypothetical protein
MLFAKINPTGKIVFQTSAFEFKVVDAEYMSAYARPYILGGESTNFRVVFGIFNNGGTPADPALPPFNVVYEQYIVLTQEQLSDWGEDDSVVLTAIANTVGTQVVEFVNRPDIITV